MGFQFKEKAAGVGEMVYLLRIYTALTEDLSWVSASTLGDSQPPVSPTAGDPTHSSELHEHQHPHVHSPHRHTDKHIHKKYSIFLKERSQQ